MKKNYTWAQDVDVSQAHVLLVVVGHVSPNMIIYLKYNLNCTADADGHRSRITVLSYHLLYRTTPLKICPDYNTPLFFPTKWHLELESKLTLQTRMKNLLILTLASAPISIPIMVMMPMSLVPLEVTIPIQLVLERQQVQLRRCGTNNIELVNTSN